MTGEVGASRSWVFIANTWLDAGVGESLGESPALPFLAAHRSGRCRFVSRRWMARGRTTGRLSRALSAAVGHHRVCLPATLRRTSIESSPVPSSPVLSRPVQSSPGASFALSESSVRSAGFADPKGPAGSKGRTARRHSSTHNGRRAAESDRGPARVQPSAAGRGPAATGCLCARAERTAPIFAAAGGLPRGC